MTLTCAECGHVWEAPVRPDHCPACGCVLEAQGQLLAIDPDIIASVRFRYPAWQDRDAYEAWVIRNAERVVAGALCSGCGSMMSANKKAAGRPTRCIVCASGYGPMSTGRRRRAPARPKSLTERNMEILDG